MPLVVLLDDEEALPVGHVLRHCARWSLTLYPEAGEAGGCFEPTNRRAPRAVWAGADDPGRARREADRRARATLRRYAAANGLDRLGTLTYADACFDHARLKVDVARFFRLLRRELGGRPEPYIWVSEWHPGGHGLHVHFALGRFVPYELIGDTWRLGRTDILRFRAPARSAAPRDAARAAARYLAKYVSKASTDRPTGAHRYEVAQGFQPRKVRLFGTDREEVIGRASAEMGGAPTYVWHSESINDWAGPPAIWCAW